MAYPSAPVQRPRLIAILAILVILAALGVTVLAALGLFGVAFLGLGLPQAPTGTVLGILAVALVLGLVLMASGVGLWRMRRWAWLLALLATLAGLGVQLYGWYTQGMPTMTTGTMISIGLLALLFVYLLAVSKHFGRKTTTTV